MRTGILTLTASLVAVVLLAGAWGLRDGASPASAQADPADILNQGVDAFNRGDVDAVMELYADGAVFAGIVPCAPVECGGKGAIRNAVEFYVADNIHITIVSSEVSGSMVTGSAQIESDMVRGAGAERFVSSYLVELSGDKIAQQRFDFDVSDSETAAFLAEVGANTVSVQLAPDHPTGQIPGWAQLLGFGDRTAVTVSLSMPGPEGVPQPVSIHEGSCAELGAVAYALQDARGGISATVLDVPLSDLQTGNLAVNVQQSRDDPNTHVACGDIPAAAAEEGPTSTPRETALEPTGTAAETAVAPTEAGGGGAEEDGGGGISAWWYVLAAGLGLVVVVGVVVFIRARSRGAAGG